MQMDMADYLGSIPAPQLTQHSLVMQMKMIILAPSFFHPARECKAMMLILELCDFW
jgi:hypothetical protein